MFIVAFSCLATHSVFSESPAANQRTGVKNISKTAGKNVNRNVSKGTPPHSVEAEELYRSQKYKEAILHFNKIKRLGHKMTYKDYVLLIISYQKISDVEGKVRNLQRALKDFPEKDIFKRELAKALEEKSNAYADTSSYAELKQNLKIEAVKILTDLYNGSPTKENFTALIDYYNRTEDYSEAIGLLELYARKNMKGKIYYTYLCEAQYKSKFYGTAAETCGKLITSFPDSVKGHLYYGKSLSKVGESGAAQDAFVRVSGRFPASSSIQFEVGKALIAKGENQKGLSHLEKHLKLNPSDEALVLRADTLFAMKQYDKALDAFVAACKQHAEPRKPLINKMKAASKKFPVKTKYRKLYESETGRCKYVYRPDKKTPKGLLGGGYSSR